MSRQHPIFGEIDSVTGDRPEGMHFDYAGALFRTAWDGGGYFVAAQQNVKMPPPPFDEEYFEWVDVLESIRNARRRYVMLELGAGYGRWAIRAGRIAIARGIGDITLRLIEAEPQHALWLKEALALNGLAERAAVIEKAITYGGKPVPFMVARDDLKADNWYGQALGWEATGAETGTSYLGHPVYLSERGTSHILVPATTLEEAAQGLDVIDLIDMDLQRAELLVVRHSMEFLNSAVKRVHIGTHSVEIEQELRETFSAQGWRNVWDFGCLKQNITPYGSINFTDGVQGWINPRLE